MYREIHRNILSKNIRFATVVENGGIASAVVKSCLGNGFGFRFEGDCDCLLSEHYGEILVALDDPDSLHCPKIYVGETTDSDFIYDKEKISIAEAEEAFCATLENVFPNHAAASGKAKDVDFKTSTRYTNISTKMCIRDSGSIGEEPICRAHVYPAGSEYARKLGECEDECFAGKYQRKEADYHR